MATLLDKKLEKPMHRAVCSAGAAVFWYLFAHGYRFSNNMFSHDSLLGIRQQDNSWEVSLGRYLQPVLILVRGGLTNPWLISFCAMICLTLGIWLVVRMLDLKSPVSIFAAAGVMVCNPTLIALGSAFLQWLDFYVFALFLSILGIWLCRKGTVTGWIFGVAAMTFSMGVYQAYICVSIVLVMILLLREAQEESQMKPVWRKAVSYGAAILLSAALYYVLWLVFLRIFHVEPADTYNGMSSLGDYSEVSIFSMIGFAYERVFYYFWHPEIYTTMVFKGRSMGVLLTCILRCMNVVMTIGLLYDMVLINLKKKTGLWQRLLQALLFLLLPVGMNFVGILSKGMLHHLMVYAFWLLYVLAAVMAEVGRPYRKYPAVGQVLVWAAMFCFVWTNVVYANQVYLKKELQERAVTSLMTRIVADVEKTEGYVPGVTPVAFAGSFEDSPYLQQLVGFEEVLPYGMGKTSLTYVGTDYWFIQYEMSIDMNLTRIPVSERRLKELTTYPNRGSIDYIDDVLVVKISDYPDF